MGIEDDLRRAGEHVAEARRLGETAEGPRSPLEGGGREHLGSPKNTLAAAIESAAL
jgi:hypothetical protein